MGRAIHISSVDREKSGVSKCEDFVIKFTPSLYLDTNMKHEVAVDQISMTYSWHNISPKYEYNTIKYSHDNGRTWTTLTFPNGTCWVVKLLLVIMPLKLKMSSQRLHIPYTS